VGSGVTEASSPGVTGTSSLIEVKSSVPVRRESECHMPLWASHTRTSLCEHQLAMRLPSGLTAREAEVLVRLGQGRSNPQIAAELQVSRKTVSSHLEHIYAKLGVKTRTEAALFAMRHGLITMAANPGPDEKIG